MKPPRFSLRGLLVLTACLAAFCYWRDRPRQNANRLVAAIEAGNYKLAESMFGERVGLTKPGDMSKLRATRKSVTTADWLLGRCYVDITISGTFGEYTYFYTALVTATGPQPVGDWSGARNALPANPPGE